MVKKVTFAIGFLAGGGAERVVSIWANNLSDKGYEVSIIVLGRKENEYIVSQNVHIYAVSATNEDVLQLSYWDRIKRFRKIIKNITPDYIISFMPTMQQYTLLATIGLNVGRIETIRINPWYMQLSKFRYMLWKLCYKTADKIILQTREQAPFFSKSEQKKSIVIPNPLNDVFITTYKHEISERVTNFIAAGRIDPQKNYEMMIDGFANVACRYPHIKLHIFGSGPEEYMRTLQDRIESLQMGRNIFLMGRSNHIEQELIKNDVFLMTSNCEGSPNALIEAMASQLVCISTDCKTGPKDLISDGETGFLIPTGDRKKLSDTILNIIEMDQTTRTKIATAARSQILHNHSKESSVNLLCSLFK